jgi:D-alanyl-D-alanine carboxypeptidase (penicillin-binding protein 5/6)
VAKVILALCVLDKSPIEVGKTGKTYTIDTADVASYNNYVAANGSVAAVAEGEQLTEYQALEALMIPSANNIADSLAKWEFGSNAGYAAYAANYLANHQINNTTIGSTDASGYDASTTSTTSDLTKIGLIALQNPVLMKIAGQKSTTLPVAGVVNNYNTVLGVNGITGLKTGNNDADPGAFLFTANLKIGTETIQATGAVMGANDLQSALDSATRLSASMQQSFEQTTIASAGQTVGSMNTAWGESAPIVTTSKVALVRWQDTAFKETHRVRATLTEGNVGSLQVSAPGTSSETILRLKHTIPGPSFWWRLTRH